MLILNYNNMLLRYDFMCNENIITEELETKINNIKSNMLKLNKNIDIINETMDNNNSIKGITNNSINDILKLNIINKNIIIKKKTPNNLENISKVNL